ncbi:MAG: HD domain-containing protein [Hydrogenophaga sp.]|uniref:HD domain-containing protein n=1 Tax=Hydrogenophaga sp. TaxID=1904254 RepID=UPI0025BD7F35|nr:HD domain-containing protein [Hydrogenophaga sp.]MBT9552652.1 HD domain-containing protein [Hydrogenophaga sp.]
MQEKPRATFKRMEQSTQQDWACILPEAMAMAKALPDRVLAHLQLLDGDHGGFPVDRLTHSLQTATLAHQDGRDEEYVVCALLHDIGDTLGSFNHPDIAAAILKPFVSEANLWMVQHHGIFQGYNFFHHIGLDRNMRDLFKDHPHRDRAAEFVERYDNPAFDPAMEALPLSFFEPMVRRLMAAPKQSVYKAALPGAPQSA